MGLSKQKKNEELRELFVQAFADAKVKGKPCWRKMNLSVLKNRLLQRSERRFRESDYGGMTMQELVERFPDVLAIGNGRDPSVNFLVEVADKNLTEAEGLTTDDGGDAAEPEDAAAGFQAILDRYRTSGDNLGVGEAYASQLTSVDDVEKTFVNIVTQWASSNPVHAEINTIGDLLEHVDKFVIDLLAWRSSMQRSGRRRRGGSFPRGWATSTIGWRSLSDRCSGCRRKPARPQRCARPRPRRRN